MILKSLFAPVLLVVVSVTFKRFISVWLHWSLGSVNKDNEATSLFGHKNSRYQVLDNVECVNVY